MLAADPDSELTNRIMLRAADGRVLPFEVSSVGVRRDGVFTGIQGAARDITERERLERELRDSEERYRFLVENAPGRRLLDRRPRASSRSCPRRSRR